MRAPQSRALSAALILTAAAACSSGERTASDSAAGTTAAGEAVAAKCVGDNAGLTLPSGVCATVFADSVGRARHIAIAANGDVYVALEGTATKQTPQPAAVIALRDTTRDGKADVTAKIGTTGNTGVVLANGYLYVDEGKQIVRYKRGDDELAPSGAREVVVSNIPLLPGHRARSVAVGNDGSLFVNVGSFSNSCQKKERTTESLGNDPCTELETRAGIWKFDANKTGQTFSPAARYATGIRNGLGLTIRPNDGALFVTQHGRDQLHDNWPKVFPTTQYQAENPGEELLQVAQGDDFGWPYCYYAMDEKKLVTAPEYGGDGKKTDRCDSKKGPVAVFPGHWAPMGVLFYTGDRLPSRYRDGVFITFHGSWNRAPDPQAGYRVVFQPMTNGQASGEYETFADGFAGLPPGEIQPDRAKHRPVGLAQGPDGALYITDDAGGRIYRLTSAGGTGSK
ncbi:MAG TPA: PQQ-dependent sugar dehydrogenase [Gemmatimonadaceae bacterium]|nr:PQQ-dependent sugar dehydrogenase [Gemmatimonadaceae bacterium]